MYFPILLAMAMMEGSSGIYMVLWMQLRDLRCSWERSQRMGKVEIFLALFQLNLYYLVSIFYLKSPTKQSPPLRYCTPTPFKLPYWPQVPKDLTKSQVRLKVRPNRFSFSFLLPTPTSRVSSSQYAYLRRLKLIFSEFFANSLRQLLKLIEDGFQNAFPRVEASRFIQFCSLSEQSPFKYSSFLSYLLMTRLEVTGVPSDLRAHLSTILTFHCSLTRSQREDSLFDIFGSMVVS